MDTVYLLEILLSPLNVSSVNILYVVRIFSVIKQKVCGVILASCNDFEKMESKYLIWTEENIVNLIFDKIDFV